MKPIMQTTIPAEMLVTRPLPGIAACAPDDWLRVDDAYADQMTYRIELMGKKPEGVLWQDPDGLAAAQETLEEALAISGPLGFEQFGQNVLCPDGRQVAVDAERPLRTLGQLFQQDICVLEKRGDEHVLTGAVLCFPANWRLAEKAGRPLTHIHRPVEEYDDNIAKRVQRLFDGVQAGRPLWRYNRLSYENADLHQPYRRDANGAPLFVRSERQCVVRMPKTRAVIFTIHTFVVPNN